MTGRSPTKVNNRPQIVNLCGDPATFLSFPCRNLAGDPCKISRIAQVIRLTRVRICLAMKRLSGPTGFSSQSAPVASSRLTDAVAAALALGAVSLCLVLCITVLTIKASMAMPM
jgi:hypothetical protein